MPVQLCLFSQGLNVDVVASVMESKVLCNLDNFRTILKLIHFGGKCYIFTLLYYFIALVVVSVKLHINRFSVQSNQQISCVN